MTRTLALVGLTALTLVGSAAVQAQPPRQGGQDQRPGIEQRQMGQRGQHRGPGMALRGLALTDDQKAQVKAIHEKTRLEVEAVLTPEQLATLKARRDGRDGRGGRGGGR